MANVVEVLIQGRDVSQAAMKSATQSMARLQAQTATAMRQSMQFQGQMGGLGKIIMATGNIAGNFGSVHVANAAAAIATTASAAKEATQAFSLMNSTIKRSVVGLAAIGIAWGASKLLEAQENAKEAGEAMARLTVIARDAELAHVRLANGAAGAMLAEKRRHQEAVKAIDELAAKKVDLAAADAAREQESLRHSAETFALQKEELKKQRDFRALLNEEENTGNISNFIDLMDTQAAKLEASLEGRKQYIRQYEQFWMESHRSMASYAAQGLGMVANDLSDSVLAVATRTKTAASAFRELAMGIGRMFASWVLNRTIAFVAEKTMAAFGVGMARAQQLAMAPIAAAAAASWAPAATASLIATYGASASMGALLPGVAALNMTALSAMSLGGGLMSHGGVDWVPQDQTVLLQQGERVIKRNQNERLMEIIDGGGGGGGTAINVTVNLDGEAIYRAVHRASSNGRLTINAKAISP